MLGRFMCYRRQGVVGSSGQNNSRLKAGRKKEDKMFRRFTINESRLTTIIGMVMLFAGVNLFAQGPDTMWTRTFGGTDGDRGYSVRQTTDGGYIITGYTYSYGAGGSDVWLIKTDASGNKVWDKTFGGTGDEDGRSVQQTSDSGYIITGSIYPREVLLIKTNATGNTLWTKTFYGGYRGAGYSVQQTFDSGYIITGYGQTYSDSDPYVWLIKTDTSGNMVWSKTLGGGHGYSIQQTQDSGYVVTGWEYIMYPSVSYDLFIRKASKSGSTVWSKLFATGNDDYGRSVWQTSDGGYIVTGYTSTWSGGAGWLIKVDAAGIELWDKRFGGTYTGGFSVQQTFDGGYIITGRTESYVADVYLVKTDSLGDTLWTRTYGGSNNDYGYSVQQTSDSTYIVAGYTESFGAGGSDVYLIKTKTEAGGVEEATSLTPKAFFVFQNHPNPFTVTTEIEYGLPKNANVNITIYNLLGQRIATLVDRNKKAGYYTVRWDGKDNSGNKVVSGVYFCRLQTGEYKATKKMSLIK